MPKSRKTEEIHVNSEAVVARALYSASVEDFDIVGWRLADHETILEPRSEQKLVVERRVLWHPAQSLLL